MPPAVAAMAGRTPPPNRLLKTGTSSKSIATATPKIIPIFAAVTLIRERNSLDFLSRQMSPTKNAGISTPPQMV